MKITKSGTSLNPIIIDGGGDVIDAGAHLVDWVQMGGGLWTQPEGSFKADKARLPGWYRVGDKATVIGKELGNNGDMIHDLDNGSIILKSDLHPMDAFGTIIVPQRFAGIENTASHLRIKNFTIENAIGAGAHNKLTRNVEYDNVNVHFAGGGVSNLGLPRAGDCITFDYSTYDAHVTNCHLTDGFDNGVTMQLYRKYKEYAVNVEFDHNVIERCGGFMAFSCHSDQPSIMTELMARDNVGHDIGYGWSGYKATTEPDGNSAHGRGILWKSHNRNALVRGKTQNNTLTHYAWHPSINIGAIVEDLGGNKDYLGTGDYLRWKNS